MSSKIWFWKKVSGNTNHFNDILYLCPKLLPSQGILIYFGGDVQDIEENMKQHPDSKKYVEWSLENTAHILSTNFPTKHVLVIRPSRIHLTRNASFSCYDNFVPSNEYGVPSFSPCHNALKHLQGLVNSLLENLKAYNKNEDPTHFNIGETTLSLMGFSKGCVVLNQLLHEFHYYRNKSHFDFEISNFIKLIDYMWWLDGGHGGLKDTWITDKPILESFANLKIGVHVHVTPYQVCDFHRPWIREEENQFCNILQSMGVPLKRILHFADEPRSLELHFNVLKTIGNYT
nr:UPF0565 protein C2orf69 homolog [Nomia melanderi]XP_031844799.1 UPF0565 protein C2orf69 homolog [Nomia melanderi]XP_031844881.1 UPF0565 protein C2orf69 homolog [Nomia melanderi]XP_031844978.1 UPF0565 protein C2orf69 homolog [Nomia melanderi]